MKILIVSNQPTHPTIAGNRRFILNQAELFRKIGHEVFFLFVNGSYENSKEINAMRSFWTDHFLCYEASFLYKIKRKIEFRFRRFFKFYQYKCDSIYPHGLTRFIKNIQKIHHFDVCITNYYFMTKFFDYVNFPLVAVTTHDYFAFKDLYTGTQDAWMLTTADEEAKGLQRCPHIFSLNTEESVYFSKISPCSRIYNVFSCFVYEPSPIVGGKNILFLSGPNEYNVNGLKWFLNDVYPEIIKKIPDVKLIIGGGICGVLGFLSNNPHIVLYGPVDNAKKFYELGDVFINPTYQGTGLKIKTFESIAYDKVTMVHPHSMVGIYSEENAPIFSSENSQEWVEFLNNLWLDSERIGAIKVRNKMYMDEMQKFIRSEYERFFDLSKAKGISKV